MKKKLLCLVFIIKGEGSTLTRCHCGTLACSIIDILILEKKNQKHSNNQKIHKKSFHNKP